MSKITTDWRPVVMEFPVESVRAHPAFDTPTYFFTKKRSPKRPLIFIPQSATELTGPIYGHEVVRELDNDLTRQHDGDPAGERIIVHGRVVNESGQGVPNTLIEIWQANASGRYIHKHDNHGAPLDPNFSGAGRAVTAADGSYSFTTVMPGAYPVTGLWNTWRPRHIHISLFGPSFISRLVSQIYFEGDPLLKFDTIYNTAPDHSKAVMVAKLDMENTKSEWALAFHHDIVLRGRNISRFEDHHAH